MDLEPPSDCSQTATAIAMDGAKPGSSTYTLTEPTKATLAPCLEVLYPLHNNSLDQCLAGIQHWAEQDVENCIQDMRQPSSWSQGTVITGGHSSAASDYGCVSMPNLQPGETGNRVQSKASKRGRKGTSRAQSMPLPYFDGIDLSRLASSHDLSDASIQLPDSTAASQSMSASVWLPPPLDLPPLPQHPIPTNQPFNEQLPQLPLPPDQPLYGQGLPQDQPYQLQSVASAPVPSIWDSVKTALNGLNGPMQPSLSHGGLDAMQQQPLPPLPTLPSMPLMRGSNLVPELTLHAYSAPPSSRLSRQHSRQSSRAVAQDVSSMSAGACSGDVHGPSKGGYDASSRESVEHGGRGVGQLRGLESTFEEGVVGMHVAREFYDYFNSDRRPVPLPPIIIKDITKDLMKDYKGIQYRRKLQQQQQQSGMQQPGMQQSAMQQSGIGHDGPQPPLPPLPAPGFMPGPYEPSTLSMPGQYDPSTLSMPGQPVNTFAGPLDSHPRSQRQDDSMGAVSHDMAGAADTRASALVSSLSTPPPPLGTPRGTSRSPRVSLPPHSTSSSFTHHTHHTHHTSLAPSPGRLNPGLETYLPYPATGSHVARAAQACQQQQPAGREPLPVKRKVPDLGNVLINALPMTLDLADDPAGFKSRLSPASRAGSEVPIGSGPVTAMPPMPAREQPIRVVTPRVANDGVVGGSSKLRQSCSASPRDAHILRTTSAVFAGVQQTDPPVDMLADVHQVSRLGSMPPALHL